MPAPDPVRLPSSGTPQSSGSGKALYYFEGSVDVAHRTMSLDYRSPTGELIGQSTLPYGTLPGEAYFHTCAGTVAWNPTGGVGPGGTLTAQIQAVNLFPDAIGAMTAVIDTVSPSDITFSTPMANYGDVIPNTANCGGPLFPWTFNDPTGEDFTFTGEADGTYLPETHTYCSFPEPPFATRALTYNGNASAVSPLIQLTTAGVNEASSVFTTEPIPRSAATSFKAHFSFEMGPAAGGEGLAFVLQSSAARQAALGGIGQAMGYGGVSPSVEIEFDTFKNSPLDPNANHVGLMVNGSATAHIATAVPAFTMAGGGVLQAWVDYDSATTTIKVYLSKATTKPAAPLLVHALNLFGQLGSSSDMYVGFTSATGATAAEVNEHDVLEFEFSTVGVVCGCEGDVACSGLAATPACSSYAGICAACSATNHTTCTGATPVCDLGTNTCVGCQSNADCISPTPTCDQATYTCGT